MNEFGIFILIIFSVIVLFYLYRMYANLIVLKNEALSALSVIDIQGQKRLDLIPNMMKTLQRHLVHEKDLFTDVSLAREGAQKLSGLDLSRIDPSDIRNMFNAQNHLSNLLSGISVKIEAYPDAKTDQNVAKAMDSLTDVDDNIAAARRMYTSAVQSLNIAVETFPSSLMTGFANAKQMPPWEAPNKEAANTAPDVGNYLK